MEEVVSRSNMMKAYNRVISSKETAGIAKLLWVSPRQERPSGCSGRSSIREFLEERLKLKVNDSKQN